MFFYQFFLLFTLQCTVALLVLICKRFREFEEIHKRLREFEEIEISRQRRRGDYEYGGKLLRLFAWILSKNSASGNPP